jgi:hypothetical protein
LAEGFGFSWPICFQRENGGFSGVEDRTRDVTVMASTAVLKSEALPVRISREHYTANLIKSRIPQNPRLGRVLNPRFLLISRAETRFSKLCAKSPGRSVNRMTKYSTADKRARRASKYGPPAQCIVRFVQAFRDATKASNQMHKEVTHAVNPSETDRSAALPRLV